MENIFKNAYLGKAYKTRDGRKAIFYNHHNTYAREKANYVTMILEEKEYIYRWYYNGEATDSQEYLDIISEWEEPIEVDKIDNLAKNYESQMGYYEYCHEDIVDAFKAGYRKAKEC